MARKIRFKTFQSEGNIRSNNYAQILHEVEEKISIWVSEENPNIISIQLKGGSWMSPYLEAVAVWEVMND